MSRLINKLRKEISESYGGQPIDAREFHSKMLLKADVTDIHDIQDIMVVKEDHEQINRSFRHSKWQIMQILVVWIEYMK